MSAHGVQTLCHCLAQLDYSGCCICSEANACRCWLRFSSSKLVWMQQMQHSGRYMRGELLQDVCTACCVHNLQDTAVLFAVYAVMSSLQPQQLSVHPLLRIALLQAGNFVLMSRYHHLELMQIKRVAAPSQGVYQGRWGLLTYLPWRRKVRGELPTLTEAEMAQYRSALYGVAAAVGHVPRMSLAGQTPPERE